MIIRMNDIMRWKADKEISILNMRLEELARQQRSRRKTIGDLSRLSSKSIPITDVIFNADSELRNLVDEENVIRQKIVAWNTLLKVNMNQLPSDLVKQINEEYVEYKNKLISEAINLLFVYDSESKIFIQT